MSYDAPFAGLKVVDLSQGVAGPYCGMLLAQNGADVIKVEPPGAGDWSRAVGRRYGHHTAYSATVNLGKRSIALDLKSAEGKTVLWRLIEGADVLLEGYRPGVLDRLGFSYEAVRKREPRIIYLSVSGFGQSGPLAARPAMDPVLQAYTGLMVDNKGEDGIPHRVPFAVIDMSTGLYAFQAVSAALYARRDLDHGRRIEVSLMQVAAQVQSIRMMMVYLEGTQTRRAEPSGVYKTADGWLQFLVLKAESWVALCGAIGRPDLIVDPRFADDERRVTNGEALRAIVREVIAGQTTAHWSGRLTEVDIMHERLNTFREFLAEPQAVASDVVSWLSLPDIPEPFPAPNLTGRAPFVQGSARGTAPVPGQHNAEILGQHGFSKAEIAALERSKVVAG